MEERARVVLNKSIELLHQIEKKDLFNTIEKGIFANIKRAVQGGKGLEGVIKREKSYYNPFMEIMAKQLKRGDN